MTEVSYPYTRNPFPLLSVAFFQTTFPSLPCMCVSCDWFVASRMWVKIWVQILGQGFQEASVAPLHSSLFFCRLFELKKMDSREKQNNKMERAWIPESLCGGTLSAEQEYPPWMVTWAKREISEKFRDHHRVCLKGWVGSEWVESLGRSLVSQSWVQTALGSVLSLSVCVTLNKWLHFPESLGVIMELILQGCWEDSTAWYT